MVNGDLDEIIKEAKELADNNTATKLEDYLYIAEKNQLYEEQRVLEMALFEQNVEVQTIILQ